MLLWFRIHGRNEQRSNVHPRSFSRRQNPGFFPDKKMKKNKTKLAPMMKTEDLVEITDKVNLEAYIFHDTGYNEDVIVLRVFTENNPGAGLNLPPHLSAPIIEELKGKGLI